jgi:hypothetical protein
MDVNVWRNWLNELSMLGKREVGSPQLMSEVPANREVADCRFSDVVTQSMCVIDSHIHSYTPVSNLVI